jgi:spore maturation protein CgeB
MFYHSVLSDWNHGNAHFLRGFATELIARGNRVVIYEERHGWSIENLIQEHGVEALERFATVYPSIKVVRYDPETLNIDDVLRSADAVIVHEWNRPELVARIGKHRRDRGEYVLFFHDTHHRSVSDPKAMSAYDLRHYDGVLAYGASIRDVYLHRGWSDHVEVWHEAADTSVFYPRHSFSNPAQPTETKLNGAKSNGGKFNGAKSNGNNGHRVYEGDVVWIGNWGDDERVEEIREFLIEPVKQLRLKARVYGVRYPQSAIDALAAAGIEYAGWLPNFDVPTVFSKFRATVHIQRRPYTRLLRGIPTIRPFEALACGIPMVSSPWDDIEGLFTAGADYLVARDSASMIGHLRWIIDNPSEARAIAAHGFRTILERHTCVHRIDQLYKFMLRSKESSLVAKS